MSTLIVMLPSSQALDADAWASLTLPFALLARDGAILHTGQSRFEALPKAGATVLVLSASDTLMLHLILPPVTGPRLRRLLPNLVEDHLIRDAQHCHIALDPVPLASGERCVAAIDRAWFAQLLEQFSQAGHGALRVVPLLYCIPLPTLIEPPETQPVLSTEHAAVSSHDAATAPLPEMPIGVLARVRQGYDETIDDAGDGTDTLVELAVRQGIFGFGMNVSASQLTTTLEQLASRGELLVQVFSEDAHACADTPSSTAPLESSLANAAKLPFATVARQALACRFNLCQFEFATAARGRAAVAGFKYWRIPLGFLGAALLVSLLAVNLQWFELRRHSEMLKSQMTERVKSAFPQIAVILDPAAQMRSELLRLRRSAGILQSGDFEALAANLAHALGPIPSTSIAELNYNGEAIDLSFKPGSSIDESGLKQRCMMNGLAVREEDGKWTIKAK